MKTLVVLALMAGIPATAYAQPAIAGLVRDPSGAPIPGVVVEASSPPLIERNRTAVTDSDGRYRIDNLPPGRYIVRFTGKGWVSLERKGVELIGSSETTVNVSLVLEPVTTVITIVEEPDPVDVTSVQRKVTLGSSVVKSVPTARSYNALLPLVPGVVTNVNDTVIATAIGVLSNSWWPDQRGPAHARRADGRQSAERQLGNELRDRRRRRAGGHVHDVGVAGRDGNRRARHEHRAEERRQHDARLVLRQRHGRESSSPTT